MAGSQTRYAWKKLRAQWLLLSQVPCLIGGAMDWQPCAPRPTSRSVQAVWGRTASVQAVWGRTAAGRVPPKGFCRGGQKSVIKSDNTGRRSGHSPETSRWRLAPSPSRDLARIQQRPHEALADRSRPSVLIADASSLPDESVRIEDSPPAGSTQGNL